MRILHFVVRTYERVGIRMRRVLFNRAWVCDTVHACAHVQSGKRDLQIWHFFVLSLSLTGRAIAEHARVAIVRIRTNPDPNDLDVYYILSSSPFFPDEINATHSKSVKLPSSRSHLFRHGYTGDPERRNVC